MVVYDMQITQITAMTVLFGKRVRHTSVLCNDVFLWLIQPEISVGGTIGREGTEADC
jgi:hypothetical protein